MKRTAEVDAVSMLSHRLLFISILNLSDRGNIIMNNSETKVCCKCNNDLPLTMFSFRSKAKGWYNSWCKQCTKGYYNTNKDQIRERQKDYNEQHKEILNQTSKKWYDTNIDYARNKQKEYYQENKDDIKLYQQSYNIKNKDKIISNKKKYYQKHKDRIIKRGLIYHHNKYHTDSKYKVSHILRSRLHNAITQYKLKKEYSTIEYLGCSIDQLMLHLQYTAECNGYINFDIYSYNSSEYHIDHIKTFYDMYNGRYTIEEVCHYTNLQILQSDCNLSKGRNSW